MRHLLPLILATAPAFGAISLPSNEAGLELKAEDAATRREWALAEL